MWKIVQKQMSNKYFGIIQNSSGLYVTASLLKNEAGDYTNPTFRTSESIDFKDELIWGKNGVVYGIPVKYQPENSKVIYEHYNASINCSDSVLKTMANHPDLNFAVDLVDANLVKIVSENAFLTTVPLYLSDYKEDSFISIYSAEEYYLIGITVKGYQKAAFRLNSNKDEELIGYIGRLKRYWSMKNASEKFPEMVIFINRNESPLLLMLKPHTINYGSFEDLSLDKIRALGLALAQIGDNVAVFKEETERSSFRDKRYVINMASIVIFAATLISVVSLLLLGKFNGFKLSSLKKEYARIISADAEIKGLKDRNRELASTILYMESNISKRTRWAEFLQLLGKSAPKGLFIEKLGSEPVKGVSNQIKIALLGYSSEEISITKLISLLQKTAYITKVSLVSMEKDKKRNDKYRFKVICTLLSDK